MRNVTQGCPRHLRKEPIHDKGYTHGDCLWRMACVGYRA
jgi:hypothetical protein